MSKGMEENRVDVSSILSRFVYLFYVYSITCTESIRFCSYIFFCTCICVIDASS